MLSSWRKMPCLKAPSCSAWTLHALWFAASALWMMLTNVNSSIEYRQMRLKPLKIAPASFTRVYLAMNFSAQKRGD